MVGVTKWPCIPWEVGNLVIWSSTRHFLKLPKFPKLPNKLDLFFQKLKSGPHRATTVDFGLRIPLRPCYVLRGAFICLSFDRLCMKRARWGCVECLIGCTTGLLDGGCTALEWCGIWQTCRPCDWVVYRPWVVRSLGSVWSLLWFYILRPFRAPIAWEF